jgi:hypothetical protein
VCSVRMCCNSDRLVHVFGMPRRFSGRNVSTAFYLCGYAEARVKAKHPAEWSVVLRWTPERRYLPVGLSSEQETADMIGCVQRVLEVL